MTEENTDGQQAGNTGGEGFAPITSQEQLDRLIGERINKVKSQFSDYDDLKSKAEKFDKAEEANKSELEKERETRTKAEKERDDLLLGKVRAEIALDKGLTPSQAKRLVGSTKEELEADADELITDLGSTTKQPPRNPGSLKSGSKGGGDAGQSGKQKAAAAVRQLRGVGN